MSTTEPIDFSRLTLVDTITLLRTHRLTSTELVTETLRRAHANSSLNAISLLDTDNALTQAKLADSLLSSPTPRPLEGVPIFIKDNVHVKGLPNSAGTPSLLSFIPTSDAPIVQRLRDAGAIIVGKTHMHELAYGITGYNPLAKGEGGMGVRNPYDKTRVAGGSSSGSGAVLGARIVMGAIGTDTGGSVRIPCAVNGVSGLRPTAGRYPQAGITPLSHTRDTAGPMAQTMADVELLDRVITNSSPITPASLTTLRLGLVRDFMLDLDDDTQAAMSLTLDKLRAAGVTVVKLDEPRFFELHRLAGYQLTSYEAYDDLVRYLKEYQPQLTIDEVIEKAGSADVKALYQEIVIPRKMMTAEGEVIDSAEPYHLAMTRYRPDLQALYDTTLTTHSLSGLLFPTVPRVAFEAKEGCSNRANLRDYIRQTGVGSSAGVPGIALPMGLGEKTGMPVGLAVDGRQGGDRELIAVGMALQTVLGRLEPPAGV